MTDKETGMSNKHDVPAEVAAELARAREKFPPFHSTHEGFAILLEEVEELKQEIFHGPTSTHWDDDEPLAEARMRLMRMEAIQAAAMAQRLVEDCCDGEAPDSDATPDSKSLSFGDGNSNAGFTFFGFAPIRRETDAGADFDPPLGTPERTALHDSLWNETVRLYGDVGTAGRAYGQWLDEITRQRNEALRADAPLRETDERRCKCGKPEMAVCMEILHGPPVFIHSERDDCRAHHPFAPVEAGEVPVAKAEVILLAHQRHTSATCLCGWAELGQSHAEHVAKELDAVGMLRPATPPVDETPRGDNAEGDERRDVCVSNNDRKLWQTAELVPLVFPWEGNPSVGIDYCIAPVIKALWDAQIVTRGSCCGHGETPPSVVLESSGDAERAHGIIRANDSRPWTVLSWLLTPVEDVPPTPQEVHAHTGTYSEECPSCRSQAPATPQEAVDDLKRYLLSRDESATLSRSGTAAPQEAICATCDHFAGEHVSPAIDLDIPVSGDSCQWGSCNCRAFIPAPRQEEAAGERTLLELAGRWKARAEKSEAEVERLRTELQSIARGGGFYRRRARRALTTPTAEEQS